MPGSGGERQRKAIGWARQPFPGAALSESQLTGPGVIFRGDSVLGLYPPSCFSGSQLCHGVLRQGLSEAMEGPLTAPLLRSSGTHVHTPSVKAGFSSCLRLSRSLGRFLAQALGAASLLWFLKTSV